LTPFYGEEVTSVPEKGHESREPEEAGYSGYFRDPDGHLREIILEPAGENIAT
jgi:hypothetical protein